MSISNAEENHQIYWPLLDNKSAVPTELCLFDPIKSQVETLGYYISHSYGARETDVIPLSVHASFLHF